MNKRLVRIQSWFQLNLNEAGNDIKRENCLQTRPSLCGCIPNNDAAAQHHAKVHDSDGAIATVNSFHELICAK
jgi:hypothetical protein